MRRAILIGLGVFELVVAGLLVFLGLQLPEGAAVERGFQRAEALTGRTVSQVAHLRDQLANVNNPQSSGLKEAREGLENVAEGMEAWARALEPRMLTRLREGTGELANYLDNQVAPAARDAGARLGTVAHKFQDDARKLSDLLKKAPPDFKVAREIHDSLGRFGEGIERMTFLISPERLQTMREGFKGMEESLDTGASQVERLSGFTYPIVKFNGLKPEIDEKSFWPEGEKIADGMRKGAKAMRAANKEFETQADNLPRIQKSLEESRKTVLSLRSMLEGAIKNQGELESVLKSLPQSTATLAEELPRLAENFQKVLGETERLKNISTGLHQAQDLLANAEKTWPGARERLLRSAKELRGLRERLGGDNPGERLEQSQQGLDDLKGRLEEVQQSIPDLSRTVVMLLQGVRWLLWVLAAGLVLHCLYRLVAARTNQGNTPTPNVMA